MAEFHGGALVQNWVADLGLESLQGAHTLSIKPVSERHESNDAEKVLKKARRDFPQFYLLTGPEDEELMDALVLARVALLGDMAIPRQFVPPRVRVEVEKTTDAVERLFTVLRETVRGGSAFARVDEDERARIERDLFEVVAPGHDG